MKVDLYYTSKINCSLATAIMRQSTKQASIVTKSQGRETAGHPGGQMHREKRRVQRSHVPRLAGEHVVDGEVGELEEEELRRPAQRQRHQRLRHVARHPAHHPQPAQLLRHPHQHREPGKRVPGRFLAQAVVPIKHSR